MGICRTAQEPLESSCVIPNFHSLYGRQPMHRPLLVPIPIPMTYHLSSPPPKRKHYSGIVPFELETDGEGMKSEIVLCLSKCVHKWRWAKGNIILFLYFL